MLAVLMAPLLLPSLSAAALAANAPFADVPEDTWYAEAVNWCRENNIIGGTGETDFSPGRTTTRAQATVILYLYLNLDIYETPEVSTTQEETNQMPIQIGSTVLTAALEANSSAETLHGIC